MKNERNKSREGSKKILLLDFENIGAGKTPPQAIDAERALLGAIMFPGEAMEVASELLLPTHFYNKNHETIFRAQKNLHDAHQAIDFVSVVNELERMEKLQEIGGPAVVTGLADRTSNVSHARTWARIIYEKWIRRELVRATMTAAALAYEESEDPFDLVDSHAARVSELMFPGTVQKNLSEVLMDEWNRLIDLRKRNDDLTGVPTGFGVLDRTTGGWQDTDLIILAARPSVGKTAFALNLARNAAKDSRKPTPVAVFSLEMSAPQLVRRLVSAESGIDLEKLSNPKRLAEDELELVYTNGMAMIESYPLFIDDTAAMSLHEARAKARRLKREHNIGLLIIDYLQLMSGDGRGSTREQEISAISRGLKALAKELGIPIIALSQLSRDNEKHGREPRLSDLRESGSIEQDADVVVFLTRADYQQNQEEASALEISNQAYTDFRKHRNGPLIKLPFYTALNIQRWMTPLEWETYQANIAPENFLYQNNRAADSSGGARLFIQN